MTILSVIAFSALILAVVSIAFGISGRYQFYWMAALGIYIFSFLAGFSIGQLTVGLTFIPLTLAIGYTFSWIKSKVHALMFLSIGIIIGFLMVLFVDDAYLFFPYWFLLS